MFNTFFTPENMLVLLKSTKEMIYMVVGAGLFSTLLGVPLGAILYLTRKGHIKENKFIYFLLSISINTLRAIPILLIIVLLVVTGITKAIVGTWMGSIAMIVPLTVAATPYMARLIEGVFLNIPTGLIEAARSMGANNLQIFFKFMLAESLPGIINTMIIVMVSLTDASAIAGVANGGGLGFLGVKAGLYQYNPSLFFGAILLLILFVFLLQYLGNLLVNYLTH